MKDKKASLGYLQYNLLRLKIYYENDLNRENRKLDSYIEDLDKRIKKNLDVDIERVEKDAKEFWKDLISKAISELLNTIEKRRTKGSEFSKIKSKLEKTKGELPYNDSDIGKLGSFYEEDLKSLRDQTKEKIDIEKFIKKHRRIDLIIGFIFGIIASVIAWFIITLLSG